MEVRFGPRTVRMFMASLQRSTVLESQGRGIQRLGDTIASPLLTNSNPFVQAGLDPQDLFTGLLEKA